MSKKLKNGRDVLMNKISTTTTPQARVPLILTNNEDRDEKSMKHELTPSYTI